MFNLYKIQISGISSGSVVAFSRVGGHPSPSDREPVGGNLELGELEQLTITNDNESSSYDVRNLHLISFLIRIKVMQEKINDQIGFR